MSIGSFVRDRVVPGRGDPITVHDPATGAVAFTYADAGAEVVAEAAATALEGATAWQALGAAERGRRLWVLAQRLRDASERVARIEATNVGKPLADARAEVGKVAEMFEYYAGWCDKLMGRVVPVPTSHHNHTRKVPYGVILTITPWNAPLFVAGWNAAPALACGNAVILKPSEWTPASALELARLALEAGLPEGALQVVAGLGASTGASAIRHPAVAKVTFIGSPASGRIIAGLCAEAPKPCVLELGGKSANVVFADARLDRAVGGAAAAIFAASGQSCVAGSRLLVERAIHDEVVDRLVALTERIRIGAPLEADTQIGPLQNAAQLARTTALVEGAVRDGCRLATGGHRPRSEGYFYAPTVVVGA
ncbi:MAG: aldehyde dehydrogenase family protein, partial [Pseudomonadota bacterium]